MSDFEGKARRTVEEDLEDLYENAPCGYISIGSDGRVVKSNLTLSAWIGFPREELLGKRMRDILTTSSAIFYETHFAPLLRMQGFFDEVALDLVTAEGEKLAILANAAERRDDKGNLLFTRLTILRATERRRYERELVDARAAAERGLQLERAALELHEQFVAVLGHDLRNPLAGIEGGLRLIARKLAADADPAIINLMLQSVNRMRSLIDDVLDLTRGRLGGGIQLDVKRRQSLEPLLTQVIDELQIASPDRVIDRHFELADLVDYDEVRIGQLLSNLIGNALSHGSSDAPILVEAITQGGELRVSVSNSGLPIPPATMERLFQPFHRGEAKSNRKGLGLGLYIASQIAEAHGGKLSAVSDDNRTVFTMVMPLVETNLAE
ncbi:MAG: ATP-binding protein [Hoeflea sp.]|uniref:PAS domain-containing sensor histidine kinase n=1 Tax=Hoeflea sp. TaxID=1940281 RepID=UPI003EF7BE9B